MVSESVVTRGFVIAAPSSGTGKTTLTLGLIAAMRSRGFRVAPAKVGPDYIDPRFLEAAAASPCLNLDPWAMTAERVRGRLADHARGADLAVIEGVMGMFDGADSGGGSTADLARILELPIVFVVDASRASQSIGAVVHGFATYRPDNGPGSRIAGVIATRVASDRHARMIETALADPALPPLLGAFRRDADLVVQSRHLGLVQAIEHAALRPMVERAASNVERDIRLGDLIALAKPIGGGALARRIAPLGQRIAVARDNAFGFLYHHILHDWRASGAELLFFSPLENEAPSPDSDAVFLPGGYPELYAEEIAAATLFREGVRARASDGALIYGECGGYMVMGAALIDGAGRSHPMLGLLDHVTSFALRKRTLGYRILRTADPDLSRLPFPRTVYGHEFHYSTVETAGTDPPLFTATDTIGSDIGPLGGCRGRVAGSYAHVIDVD